MQFMPDPAPQRDDAEAGSGVMAASPHLLDALQALSAMAAAERGVEARFSLSDPSSCSTPIDTTTTSASATTCKP